MQPAKHSTNTTNNNSKQSKDGTHDKLRTLVSVPEANTKQNSQSYHQDAKVRVTKACVVSVFEETMVGGNRRTEYPFPKVPGLGYSTGAYPLRHAS
jgi:hypothetical protein